ncbi:MAG TPA: WD40 repeat domain-containing serine/threonine-protein kinase [Planctomycetaceae bacterium]|nr:WD40 repeat domain-containing serine/threonine-protein kinase [Planctomycetaceae bacterium]
MSQNLSLLQSLFFGALEKQSPAERRAFLDEACAGKDELRRSVERMLAAHSNVGSFLESPAAAFAPTIATRPVAETPGMVIGPYKLLEQIGEGGFGIVYMAEQQAPVRRRVALKIIKPGMDTKEVLARFKAEQQALALMDHVNIARVLDAGATDAGRPYFVMELVRGVPITEYCDLNTLAIHERLDLFVQVCHAVQHAHQKGIIHRDIKPSNVLVTMQDARPVPKVIDFGVAKAIDRPLTPETLFTRFAEMIGTPIYMSPEQAEMTSLDIDTRSDIYSLGVLLYELLTGSTPFDKTRLKQAAFDKIRRIIREEEPARPSTRISTMGQTVVAVAAHRHADPNRLSQLIRGDLDWIVMKALEKDRTRRYETANSLALDVERYLADEPVQACPPSTVYRVRKFVRRHRGTVLGASIVLAALVVGIIGTTWGLIRATDAEAVAVRAADQAQKSERTRSEQLWQALVAQSRAHRVSRRPGQRFQSLETIKKATQLARTLDLPPASFQELRNAAIATLAVPDLYLAGPWNPWPTDALGLDFDEAHTLYARTDRAGNCSIRRVAGDVEIYHLPGLGLPAWPFLSRDGKFIALGDMSRGLSFGKGIHVWQLAGSTPRELLYEPKASTAVFRDSQQFALTYNDGSIGLFELPTGRQLGHLAPETQTSVNVEFHPTEPLLATCCYADQVLQLRDLRTGKVLASAPQTDRPLSIAWHPNGRILAVSYNHPQICFYDRSTFRVDRTLDDAGLVASSINFDHLGRRLAATEWGNAVSLFDVGTAEKLMLTKTMQINSVCRFSSDGLRLAGAVQEGRLGVWRVAGGQEFRTLIRSKPLPKNEKYSSGAAVHPDGRVLACAMSNGFGLWDLVTGGELGFIPSSHRANNRVVFEPSGGLLTLSYNGLSRWPLSKGSLATGELSIGPPEALPLPNGEGLDQSRDGRVVVTADRAAASQLRYAGGWILHRDQPTQPIRLDPGADLNHIAVSPDGRWVVTATHLTGLAKIWDARDGRFVRQLADWGATLPRFSPDGRWLSTTLDGGRLFAVDTWEQGPHLGGHAAFSPDSKLAAVPTQAGLRLLETASGREVAVLEDPNPDSILVVLFTPDGTKLITVNEFKGIHVWDLRLIRQALKDLGLDWNWPEFAPAPAPRQIDEPLKVEIRLGDKWVVESPEDPPDNNPPTPKPAS